MQQISDTGEANFDVKHFRKDGSSFPLHVDAKIVDWGGRKVLLSIATDLTERKRVEEIILMSEARLVQAQKTAHLGSWEWDPITGKVDWSDELCRLFEISPDTIRKGPSEVRAAIYERIHPDDLPRYKEAVARTVELNIPYAIDYRIQLPSGSERYIFAKGSHVIDEAGNIIRLVGTAIDITERKRAEDALKESEDRFRISIEKAPEAILLFDVNQDRYVDANSMAENLFGCSRQQLLDSGPHQFYKSDQPDNRPISETVDEHRRQVLAGETIKFERHIRNGRSEDLVLEIRLVMLQSAGHRLIRSSFLDITERKRADDALRQANKKLNLLSSITRHDINNQLTVQIGYLEILEDMPFNPTQNEYFLKVTNAAKRISAMIQFTKEYEDVGVHAPIWQDSRALVDTAAKQAPPGQVMVKNGLPSGTEVFADPLVVKVFYNLMDNAFRYGGKITTIRFSVLESGDFHMIVCEDDGNGVVAQDKEKIFERGFGKNTGMGLALSREILDITGITICEIGEPGKGARFEMAVPKGMWRTSLK